MGKMKQDDDNFWLDILEANLLDANYCVATDSEVDFKLAELRKMMARNEVLETALGRCYKELQAVKDTLGKVL